MEDDKTRIFFLTRSKYAGFTLVELLVAAAVMVIVSIIAVLSFQGYSKQNRLNAERDKVYNDLLDLQAHATSGKLLQMCVDASDTPTGVYCTGTCASGTCKYKASPGGYGIQLNANGTYDTFADLDNDNIFDTTPNSEKLSTKTFPSSVLFKSPAYYYSFSNQTLSASLPLTITFKLDQTISMSNSDIWILEIQLRDTANNLTSSIYLNKTTGVIYEKDTLITAPGSP